VNIHCFSAIFIKKRVFSLQCITTKRCIFY